ncbi:MAG: DMT family transporter [Verrucomicrobia bacterium]|nr:DMT family transporter [Verrucomicrobiota bacterium]
MFAALLTTILFSLSAVTATRTARMMGGTEANFWRLCIATVFLAIYAHGFGAGLSGDAFYLFILSGCIGFGLGDVTLFQALPRLGSRLTIMLVHCLAAPFAAVVEWLWLGTQLSLAEILCGAVILGGVALALAPGENPHIEPRKFSTGIFFGVLAAIGQGGGVVLSRKAYAVAAAAGQDIDGISAAYQRILGGVAIAGLCLLFVKKDFLLGNGSDGGADISTKNKWRDAGPWLVINALAGPTLGVSCYQWALKVAPAGVVLPIVALAPLVVMPFARFMEREKPSARSLLGGAVAVLGAIALALAAGRGR